MPHALDSTILHVSRTRLTNDYPEQIRACLRSLTDDEIWWRPNEKANAVGNLVIHLCGSNRFYLVHAIGGRDFARDRDAEFAERTRVPGTELMRRLDEMVRDCDEVLAQLTPDRMLETTDRTGKEGTTFAQILLHVSHHNAVHMGQIVYATKLLREGAIDELWRKGRK
jgi:uncharacterized damage-inducible protein DinB